MREGSKLAAGVTEGAILAGKYRVERVLGEGGMGIVVAARHIDLDERVAIKFLLAPMLLDGNAVARFQREAKAAVRIKNEHVVRVFDVGRLEDGAPYMVMEFLEGHDLSQWLAQYGALPLGQAVDFVVQVCVALADAHALGIVHRDLKPANLFCVRRSDGQLAIKVLDFGISKLMQAPGEGMSFTQTSAMMGSPLYMSPEQFRSTKNVDARTDIWALGAILFELMTGKPPFEAASVPELAIKIATEAPARANQLRPDVPPALAAVIAQCLEREPERRPQNVAELALALGSFATPAGRPLIERVVGIVGRGESAGAATLPLSERSSQPEARTATAIHFTASGAARRPNLARTLGALGAFGIAAAGGMIWWRTEGARSTAPALASGEIGSIAPSAVPSAPPSSSTAAAGAAFVTSAAPPAAVDARAALSAPTASSVAPPAPDAPERLSREHKKRSSPPAAKGKQVPAATAGTAQVAASAAPARSEHDHCDPPFFFDAQGNRVFKQECL
jgi:serine/threonine-protein kinase